jgi:cell division protein FtsL
MTKIITTLFSLGFDCQKQLSLSEKTIIVLLVIASFSFSILIII